MPWLPWPSSSRRLRERKNRHRASRPPSRPQHHRRHRQIRQPVRDDDHLVHPARPHGDRDRREPGAERVGRVHHHPRQGAVRRALLPGGLAGEDDLHRLRAAVARRRRGRGRQQRHEAVAQRHRAQCQHPHQVARHQDRAHRMALGQRAGDRRTGDADQTGDAEQRADLAGAQVLHDGEVQDQRGGPDAVADAVQEQRGEHAAGVVSARRVTQLRQGSGALRSVGGGRGGPGPAPRAAGPDATVRRLAPPQPHVPPLASALQVFLECDGEYRSMSRSLISRYKGSRAEPPDVRKLTGDTPVTRQ